MPSWVRHILGAVAIVILVSGCTTQNRTEKSYPAAANGGLLPCLGLSYAFDVKAAMARIAEEKPRAWPGEKPRPSLILSSDEIMKRLTKEEQEAITMYSIVGFDQVRLFEVSGKKELRAAGWSESEIKATESWSLVINRAISKLPVVEEPVFRGMRSVEPGQVARLVDHWHRRKPLGLGLKNKPAVTSASWDPAVAQNFMRAKDSLYSIFFEIQKGHGGVGIQEIALHPRQHEVLLPKERWFLIEHMAPVQDQTKMLYVLLKPIE